MRLFNEPILIISFISLAALLNVSVCSGPARIASHKHLSSVDGHIGIIGRNYEPYVIGGNRWLGIEGRAITTILHQMRMKYLIEIFDSSEAGLKEFMTNKYVRGGIFS